jgi:hypothetical protein
MADSVLHFAPEDVARFPCFVVRLWTTLSSIGMCEYEIQSAALNVEDHTPGRITSHEEDSPNQESPNPPRLEGSSR